MPEVKTQDYPCQIKLICDNCGKAEMQPTGLELSGYPPKYPYRCPLCGYMNVYGKRYPCLEYGGYHDHL